MKLPLLAVFAAALVLIIAVSQFTSELLPQSTAHQGMQGSLNELSTAWYDLVDRTEGAEEEARVADAKTAYWKWLYEDTVTSGHVCASCVEWHQLGHPRLGSEPTALTHNEEAHFWKSNSDSFRERAEQWERTAARWRARALGLEEIEEPPEPIAVSEPAEEVKPDGPPRLTFTQETVMP